MGGAGVGGAPQLVIWGTDVDVNRCKERFKRFLERYIDPSVEQDEKFDGMDINEPVYLQRLEEVCQLLYLFIYLFTSLLTYLLTSMFVVSNGLHLFRKIVKIK